MELGQKHDACLSKGQVRPKEHGGCHLNSQTWGWHVPGPRAHLHLDVLRPPACTLVFSISRVPPHSSGPPSLTSPVLRNDGEALTTANTLGPKAKLFWGGTRLDIWAFKTPPGNCKERPKMRATVLDCFPSLAYYAPWSLLKMQASGSHPRSVGSASLSVEPGNGH